MDDPNAEAVPLPEKEPVQKKKKTPEEREFEKMVKLFTSSIFDQKHGFIYLDRAEPFRMFCATYNPEELYSRSRVFMDTVRRVDTQGIDLIKLWETKLPLGDFDRFCISFSGIRSMNTKFKGDFKAMHDAWLINPDNGLRYVEKHSKQGTRIKIEVRPIIWPLSEIYFRDLEADLNGVMDWVKKCPAQTTETITRSMLDRSLVGHVNVADADICVGVKIPYSNGFNCTSLFGYSNVSKLEEVGMHIGQDGHLIQFYCTSEDQFAKVVGVLPLGYYYGKLSVDAE